MKKCSRCNNIKDNSEFYKNRRGKDGLQSRCIDCVKEVNSIYSKTDAFKESVDKYVNSDKGYKAKRNAQKRYERTLKGKRTFNKYRSKRKAI
jgi:hypothetical protein